MLNLLGYLLLMSIFWYISYIDCIIFFPPFNFLGIHIRRSLYSIRYVHTIVFYSTKSTDEPKKEMLSKYNGVISWHEKLVATKVANPYVLI